MNNSCRMGACTPAAACDFFSCAGCCSNGTCQPTSMQSPMSCGVNGATCVACGPSQSCTTGVCTGGATCNPTNCTGCCNGTTCVAPTMTSATTCGHSGNVCSACGPGQTCSAGVCVPQQNPACITISPSDVDFGTVQTGCRSEVRTFIIRNVCAFNVTLSALGVSGAGFSNSMLSLPATLAPNSLQSFTVTFAPTAAGRVDGILVVGATHSSGTFAYQTSVTGVGAATGLNQDRFAIPTKTDVLLIVDNSCSMSTYQMALGNNANAFLAYAFSANVDFNLGVTTTDMDNPLQSGRFQGTPTVLRSSTPNLLQTFNMRVNQGINGSPIEMMGEPAVQAVSPALLTTTNTGFLRSEAALSVLAFTDAEEQSAGPTSAYIQRLLDVKGHRRRNQFSFSFVGPTLPAGSRPSNCQYDGNAPDPRQIEMIASTGGFSSEICNVGPTQAWRAEAGRVGQAVFGARATWFLTGRPSPAQASSLTVTINGVTIPELGGNGRNWGYDAVRNAVIFSPNSLPAPGQTVGVDYVVACMP
ncbi:MAG: choice-of-anchor D domain-containing protein [Myxococcaceae bacterium]|nr:choice-of-anchor D domain-containing protein [Myxococcaceae bacterium]